MKLDIQAVGDIRHTPSRKVVIKPPIKASVGQEKHEEKHEEKQKWHIAQKGSTTTTTTQPT